MRKGRLFIIEPSEIVVKGLCDLFDNNSTFEIIGHIHSLRNAVEIVNKYKIDILLVNPDLFGFSNRYSIRGYFQECKGIYLAALTYHHFPQQIYNQFDTFIDITDNRIAIENKLTAVMANKKGQQFYEESTALTPKEQEVLSLIAKGLSNKEIADKLHLSIYTVVTHKRNISAKTDIKSTAGLTVYAVLHNLIDKNEMR
ncbi:MAG: response regulator transcription factor [Bacteroidales bacterium]|jgi:DNA-binding NarL/FixJ family response regulator|nr:response regulator transcription factor [Bacteroidales bacterium]MBQ4478675.1 response regulator transcription factor [Bacteroidales bacterium]MBR4452860.1 response regulator transcription factor [Bacteroidales bacterium]MCR5555028.1 response regulator transcription factor [Bacteroidales bacterium]